MGRVVRLDLSENGLAGEIPAEVGRLRFLERLDLSWNRVDESPSESVGNTRRVGDAGFPRDAREEFDGGVEAGPRRDPDWPSADASLPSASGGSRAPERTGRCMSLPSDGITGPVPRELANLSNLESLWLRSNSLRGQIPREIGSLTALEWLSLDHNQLTGEIPSELGHLDNLEGLHLAYNQLSSHIPPEIGNLSNLRILWLSRNQLVGPIPPELSYFV